MNNNRSLRKPLIVLLVMTALLVSSVIGYALTNTDANISASSAQEETTSEEYISELESENDSLRERIVEQNAQIEWLNGLLDTHDISKEPTQE